MRVKPKYGELDKDPAYQEMLQAIIDLVNKAKAKSKKTKAINYNNQKICPNCNKKHKDLDRATKDCDWVFGRRGWRQLGVYDG